MKGSARCFAVGCAVLLAVLFGSAVVVSAQGASRRARPAGDYAHRRDLRRDRGRRRRYVRGLRDGGASRVRSGLGGQDLPISGLESPLIAGLGFGPGQQVAEEAPRPSPPVPVEDATEYSGYDRAQAVALAEQAFGIEHPAWVAPQNQGSGTISKYVGSHMAEELLPDGQHVLVASSLPLRSAVGSGQEKPVSLGLSSTGSGYMPANPVVPVVLGKTPGEGVSFQFGLRMAPVGRAAPEAPVVVGDSVFYPGTAKATDFMLEVRPFGVEASWQLLSAESSGENALSFALPQGADLVMSNTVHGAAEVRAWGR